MSSAKQWTTRGAYTPDQAARLLGIQPRMVKRWVYGTGGGDAALIPEFPQHDGNLITFLDFVQSLAIRDIRKDKTVSLQKIRETVDAAKKHNVAFPFARQHRTYVFTDDVVLRLNDGRLIQVTGKYRNHDLIEPVVYSYLKDIGFDERGLANSYIPMKRGFRSVQLSPSLNYGAPTIYPCGYTVRTLVDSYHAEGRSIDAAASMCDVNKIDVELAIEYEKKLLVAA